MLLWCIGRWVHNFVKSGKGLSAKMRGVMDYKPELSPDACLGSQSGFRMHAAKGIEIDDNQAACDDELIMASPCDRVAAVAEQLTDFLSSLKTWFPIQIDHLVLHAAATPRVVTQEQWEIHAFAHIHD